LRDNLATKKWSTSDARACRGAAPTGTATGSTQLSTFCVLRRRSWMFATDSTPCPLPNLVTQLSRQDFESASDNKKRWRYQGFSKSG
jgi:hypothetical protein